jgi:hypothetical protein
MDLDFCGNPFHDVPKLILWAFPFIEPFSIWLMNRGYTRRAHSHGADCSH